MKKIILIIMAFAGFITLSPAQIDRTHPPKPGPPPKITIGDYQSFTLSNGLRVIVVENHKIPEITYSLVFDYDPVLEGNEQGYVEFTGRLLGTGSTHRTKEQINEAIDFIGASMNFTSAGADARCLKKHNDTLLDLFSDALINAKFLQEELDKIKTQALSELAAELKEPEGIANRVNKILMFGKDHPYGNSKTEASIAAVSLQRCNEFYLSNIRPNISYLAVVGDITLAEARPLIEKYFSSWTSAPVQTRTFDTPQAPSSPVVALVDRPVSVQSLIRVSYPIEYKPGVPDYIAAKMANTILGGGTFRLFNNLREKHGYTYGAYSQLTPDKYIGSFTASAEVRNSVTDSSLTQILYEMGRMGEEKVPEEELNMAKNYFSGIFLLSLESPQTIASIALNIERYLLPRDYYKDYLTRVAALTAEDIENTAKKYITPDHANLLVVGKADDIAGSIKQFSKSGKIRYFDTEGKEYDPSQKLKPLPAGVNSVSINEKYLEAIGGRKKLSKMKTLCGKMSMSMQGMSITIANYQKAPNKVLVEIAMGGNVISKQVFDGVNGYSKSQMGEEQLEGDMLEMMKYQSILNPELNYDAYGIKTQALGIETLNGKEAYKVEITYPNSKKETEYYDVETGLKVKKIGEEGVQEYTDYKEVDGIKLPFQLKQDMGGQSISVKVVSYEINKKLKDDLFKL